VFNLVALLALGVGDLTFVVVNSVTGFPNTYVALFGVASSTVMTFGVNNWLTFSVAPSMPPTKLEHYGVDLSIVIPAYQEASRIGDTLKTLALHLETNDYGTVEVVVVTADSTDGTADIVASMAHLFARFKHIHAGQKIGKGRDVALGMLNAVGRYRLFTDADLATPLSHLAAAKAIADEGGTIAIGVRNIGRYHRTFTRNLVSRACSFITQLILVPGISDTQCGFKIFEAALAEHLFSHMRILQWNFDMEILLLARLLGHHIHAIEITDWEDPKPRDEAMCGESRMRALLRGAVDPLAIRCNLWFGRYASRNQLIPAPVKVVSYPTAVD
jgi:glycosyltransferase involved in cell wall biosynthesis